MNDQEAKAFIEQLKQEGLLTEENQPIWEMIVPERLKRMYDVLNKRTRHITILTEAVDDPHNQAAVLRSAEAFGLQDIYVVTGQAPFQPNPFVTRNADKWLTVHQKSDISTAIRELQSAGYQVLASYLREGTIALHEMDVSRPTALLFGNEHRGVSEEALHLADGTFMIPMHGFVQSFNISVAAALTLYDVTQRARKQAGEAYYLTLSERKELYEKWMWQTLHPRTRKMMKMRLGK
ncbi:tRNA (guanosine(18)-2'-O)-methyltransferase [Anoxybacillus sp. P3H1B]|jgi:tRNA (guanosine-2'-O-)-methyltransferase|uniref:tRNA (guanosine(18)-2'-O)-methyltransferase n=1 Tax=Anoxybacteroides rupiense TaxID=311460 RepID=A0ABD5IVY6_9BACL|nr:MULTISPECIES: RNA methyltransferase [Anoxybacillus]KXG08587.1 tRNA (guanosine(18)-2'-O)-methyltransferase [Anoxybacillus sp. P3H1B]MBB3908228.1 tRNA (guanosine-2'-O-)-methyltransferase [Anoxybacillus rupiensis]MED5052488.1 RNA methyltransferase [Anoxybacillus rupiensis]QHC05627.1 RNA methyltransferase [Anoxybacillus sp. PDR2]